MALSRCPAIRDLQREAGQGQCFYCHRQLTGARTVVCFRADCQVEYQKLYKQCRRAALTAQGLTQRGKVRKLAPYTRNEGSSG